MPLRATTATPNVVLYNLREATGASQQDVADALNLLASTKKRKASVSANQVSRWERGITRPSPFYRRLLSAHFGVSVDDLGLSRPRAMPLHEDELPVASIDIPETSPPKAAREVVASQGAWKATRRALNTHRARLAKCVASLYEPGQQLPGTGLLANPEWLPASPVPLANIQIEHDDSTPQPSLMVERITTHVRPLETLARRFHRYSQAIRAIDHPRLFENRMAWCLQDVAWNDGQGFMAFGDTTYFDSIDLCEALAHEAAANLIRADGQLETPTWRGLTARRELADPFDLIRRAVGTSTNTLTIRRSRDGSTFVLHDRNASSVAVAGGLLHVMPCGVFQPSSIRPTAQLADFDLWRNIMREYSEEFLGNPEHDGDGLPIDYEADPFGRFQRAMQAGKIRAFGLGVGLDALTLFGEILTVVVFDADIYDALFAGMVDGNDEGALIKTGRVHPTASIPFTEHIVHELMDSGRLAPAAAGCLRLAWDHRRAVLGD